MLSSSLDRREAHPTRWPGPEPADRFVAARHHELCGRRSCSRWRGPQARKRSLGPTQLEVRKLDGFIQASDDAFAGVERRDRARMQRHVLPLRSTEEALGRTIRVKINPRTKEVRAIFGWILNFLRRVFTGLSITFSEGALVLTLSW